MDDNWYRRLIRLVERYSLDTIWSLANSFSKVVKHDGITLVFGTPNFACRNRVNQFSEKEPETLDWIERFEKTDVFFDVGANIGLYSCYAGKLGIETYCFEPSVFNIMQLATNIHRNDLSERVSVLSFPLLEQPRLDWMMHPDQTVGGALSSFSHNVTWDGSEIDANFKYKTLGMSLDAVVNWYGIPNPTHLKVDVDGIELMILEGGASVLRSVQSLLIEVNQDLKNQNAEMERILKDAGLKKIKQENSALIRSNQFSQCVNQIWVRSQ